MKSLQALILLGLSGVGVASAECSLADQKALEEFDKAWGQSSQSGDRAVLERVYASDFLDVAMDATGVNRDKAIGDAVADAEKNRGKPQTVTTVPDHYVIHCTANGATITHRNVITGIGADAKPWTQYRRSVHVLEKRKGAWQVVSNSGHALDDAGQIYYLEHDWNAADVGRDIAWYERNLAHDYTGVSSRSARLSNKEEEIADMKSSTSTLQSAVLSELDVRVAGSSAVATGVNVIKGTDDKGQAFERRIRFTDTFVRRDGRWQVWATQGTVIPDKK